MEKTLDLIYKVEVLEDLVEAQRDALQTADQLVTIKAQLILLLEDEIVLRKRQNLILASMLIASFIVFTFIISLYCTMRTRIYKGTLVGSTDKFRAIKSRRMIVEVLYSFRKGIVIEKTIDIRQTIEQ